MNSTSVTEQVNSIRNRTNLLVYYTADEPDGLENPHWAPDAAATLIHTLDPYRPSSLCLNCQDYLFKHYAAGTPILQVDVYPISINPNYSVMHDTPCSIDQGCCGCDNCVGEFEDIRNRIDEFHMRFEVLGWERIKTIWTAPQAFGNQWYVWIVEFARGCAGQITAPPSLLGIGGARQHTKSSWCRLSSRSTWARGVLSPGPTQPRQASRLPHLSLPLRFQSSHPSCCPRRCLRSPSNMRTSLPEIGWTLACGFPRRERC